MSIKILHINRNYVFNILHQKLIEALEKNPEIDNCVFVPASKEQNINYEVNNNVVISKCFRLRDRFFYYRKQRKIYNALLENFEINQFDIIHAYTLFTDGGCAYRIHKKYGIPYVVAIRNTDVNDFFRRIPFLRNYGIRILKEAEAIFFLSKAYEDILIDNYIRNNEKDLLFRKMIMIPNGVDSFWLDRSNKSIISKFDTRKNIRIIYAGRLDQNKNIVTTAKAIQILKDFGKDITFVVIGKIENQQVYDCLVRYSFVEYRPEMKKEDLIHEYRNSDIFVMPSFTETFGISYVEAMSQGLPIIYTKGQGFDQQFDEGIVGYHVNPTDANDIAKKILLITEKYDEISNRCIGESRKFDWSSISERYISIYQSIKEAN